MDTKPVYPIRRGPVDDSRIWNIGKRIQISGYPLGAAGPPVAGPQKIGVFVLASKQASKPTLATVALANSYRHRFDDRIEHAVSEIAMNSRRNSGSPGIGSATTMFVFRMGGRASRELSSSLKAR